jgi:hypothetical protein
VCSNRVPFTSMRLAPEQIGCEHAQLHWNWKRDIFECLECGAEFVIPELSEVMLLSVASE